ncbi:hypothetical protein SSS_09049 [Sarcoptes scabiei]|nr:hypothetical protein SSS_09049 [Sarcoptes scabiei]
MFVFQANAPDPSKIPVADAVGVTVVLLTCSYLNKEFVRVGYYVNNEYTDPELRENPPSIPQFDKLQRNILATDPRITKFKIDWGEEEDSSINSSNISEAFPNASNIDNLEFKQNGNGSLDNSNCFISEDSIGPLNPVTIIDNSRSMEI